jgi:hypothetical protein
MHQTHATLEAEIRATSAPRLRDELREAEARIWAEYEARIDEAVQEAVVAAELSAHEETLGRLEPSRLADIEAETDAIRARYDVWVQAEVARRLAARGRRTRPRVAGERLRRERQQA